MTTDDDREPWTKRPDESSKAFKAFSLYREMDPFDRSLRALAEMDEVDAGLRWLKEWSRTHDWQKRLDAYETHLDRMVQHKSKRRLLDCRSLLADNMYGLLQVAIGEALDGSTALLKDLLDRGGLKPPEEIEITHKGDADKADEIIDQLLGAAPDTDDTDD